MILAGQLLLNDEERPGTVRLSPGYIRVDGEQIVELVECCLDELPSQEMVDGGHGGANTLICPGLIDTHLHLPQFDTMGAHGMPLLQWLDEVTFAAERKWEDVGYAQAMTQRVVKQLFAYGTTGICAYATVHYAGALAALEIMRDAGLRGVVGQTLMNQQAPDFLIRESSQLIDETIDLLNQFKPGDRMAAAITPRFAITCSADLMAGLGKLAQEYDAMVQSHLAETKPECELVSQLFDGLSYVEVYEKAGLLTPHSVYGHGIYLNDANRQKLAASKATIAHCPTANSFLRSGTMDRRAHLGAGVKVSLGSDIGGGYDRSMVRVARAMMEAAASFADVPVAELPGASEAWWQITAGNADAMGWGDSGRLAVGHCADVLVIQPDIAWQADAVDQVVNRVVDPLAMLLFAWDDRWLKKTLVQGRVVYESR